MQIFQEAVVDGYRFTVNSEYLSITRDGESMVHLSHEAAKEVVGWLFGQLGHTAPAIHVTAVVEPPPLRREIPSTAIGMKGAVDLFAARSASLSPEGRVYAEKIGDPFLADSAPNRSSDGKQAIVGVEVADLAAESKRLGLPIPRK